MQTRFVSTPRFRCEYAGFSAGLVLCLSGCMESAAPREDETTMDLRAIARVYESMQSFNNRPPKDLGEVRQMLADWHQDKQCAEPDKVLISSRDGKPYVIILGATFGGGSPDDIIIYEETGKDGSRYVMTSGRIVLQLNDDEFRQAKFAKGHRPASS